MTREEYQKHMELVKKAVKDDLTSLDSRKTVLKARVWCRDDEDRLNLCCIMISVRIWICCPQI